ncbi:MAG: hypothetical protein IT449_17490 [Phycisphaerales bacterium]|nr:hypothetical protein [Phycisphaerales bacterium]
MIMRSARVASSIRATAALAGTCVFFAGCQNVYENMYVDTQSPHQPVETASSAKLKAMTGKAESRSRGHEAMTSPAADTRVCHGPLYFEDPFESKGSLDGKFAWTLEDHFATVYCGGRWLANTIFLPVSVTVHPIWSTACTDGAVAGPSISAPCCAKSTGSGSESCASGGCGAGGCAGSCGRSSGEPAGAASAG